jgi:hypothetical protein
MSTGLAATSSSVARDVVNLYRENGYVHIPQVLSPEEVAVFRESAPSSRSSGPAWRRCHVTTYRNACAVPNGVVVDDEAGDALRAVS